VIDPLRHHAEHADAHGAFGADAFGIAAERVARFFGTPRYIAAQTLIVACWIVCNSLGLVRFDSFPFILLNLAFSTQAAYAAPLILLAQTRQASRDKAREEADARHREELAESQAQLLAENTRLTAEVHALTVAIHGSIGGG
jgi:uncharacterized membrane protein